MRQRMRRKQLRRMLRRMSLSHSPFKIQKSLTQNQSQAFLYSLFLNSFNQKDIPKVIPPQRLISSPTLSTLAPIAQKVDFLRPSHCRSSTPMSKMNTNDPLYGSRLKVIQEFYSNPRITIYINRHIILKNNIILYQ